MALSININVNNSDISIKNSKTGAKKNIKSISARKERLPESRP